jgi:TRAP-type C4-dicarboxylate transport system permease small subunit
MKLRSFELAFKQGLGAALITIVAALLALTTLQIVLRYGFNASLLWAEEMCRYLLIWLSFLAVVIAFERGEVASLTFLSESLPRVPALLLAALAALLSAVLCLLLARYGWTYAELAGREPIPAIRFLLEDLFGTSAPAAPRIFWVYFALPLGMVFLAVRLLVNTVLYLRAIPAGINVADALERHPEEVVE